MTNTSLENELLEAIENIEMSEYTAMVESTCSLLEMYDKQLDIIEETTVPDEMLVTEFTIFKEADESDSKDDKKDDKKEGDGWFKRTFNTRFGDSAPENQKFFGRTNKEGKKENIILGLLALVPRLIVGLINLIRDKIAGTSKDEKDAAAKTAKKAADAIEKGEAEVTSDGENVKIELKNEETSENNEDKGDDNNNPPDDGGDNNPPSGGGAGSAKKVTTKTITIPEKIFETITTFASLDSKNYSDQLTRKNGRITTPMTEVIKIAKLHQEAFGKIQQFITKNSDYMKSQWGGEKQETQNKELKDLEKEINDLNKKKLSVQSPAEAEKIEKELERLNEKKKQYNNVSNMAFATTGKKKNKMFSGGTYDGNTAEGVKKSFGSGYDAGKKSLLDADTYGNDKGVKGLNGVVAKTREFMSKYGAAKKNKKGNKKEEAVIALRFIADVNTDDKMMNEFQSFDSKDLSKMNTSEVAQFAYDPDLAGMIRSYSDQVKAFSKTATQIFTAYLQTQKTLAHTRLTDKGGFDKKRVNKLGRVEGDAERIFGDKYTRETERDGLRNFKMRENAAEPDGYTKMKDELKNDKNNPVNETDFDVRFKGLATELANWIEKHKPELLKTLKNGYNLDNTYGNYTPWLKLQCDGQYANVIKRAIQTENYGQVGQIASSITKQAIQDIYDAVIKEYQGGKNDKTIRKAMDAAVVKIVKNNIAKYSDLIKDKNVKMQVESIGEDVYKKKLAEYVANEAKDPNRDPSEATILTNFNAKA